MQLNRKKKPSSLRRELTFAGSRNIMHVHSPINLPISDPTRETQAVRTNAVAHTSHHTCPEPGRSGRRDGAAPSLLYRYESYDLATSIVFKQKIDVAIECLFDIAYSTDAFEQRFPRHELVAFDFNSKQAARLQ